MTARELLRNRVLETIRTHAQKHTHMGHLRKTTAVKLAAHRVVTEGDASDEQGAILGALESLVESHEIVRHFGGAYQIAKRGAA